MTPRRRRAGALALVPWLLAACIGGPAPSAARPTTSTASAPVSPTSPPVPPSPAEPSFGPPPAPTLVAGTVRQPGEAGSYAWPGGAESVPWLPATALEGVELADRRPVTIEPARGVEVASWAARAARASDLAGERITPLGSGVGPPSFAPPPAGHWVIAVQTVFAAGGEATWYWSIEVP